MKIASGVGDGRLLAALERRHPEAAGVAARRQDGSRRIGFRFVPFTDICCFNCFLKFCQKKKKKNLCFLISLEWQSGISTLLL